MPSHSKAARRYARALFELCAPQDIGTVEQALLQLVALIQDNKNLDLALRNPATPILERTQVLQDLAKRLAPQVNTLPNFLARVLENGRIEALRDISQAFRQMADAFRKIKSLEITTATAVAADEQQALTDSIKRDFGAEAQIKWVTDSSIIGGMTVKAGDMLLDGSIRTRLEQIRSSIAQ